ncbi:hypothetical protein IF2G_04653 [Cordyceps javanica]|nr:hypothetical protein IF2G_04653 [Cordyceps javanica]
MENNAHPPRLLIPKKKCMARSGFRQLSLSLRSKKFNLASHTVNGTNVSTSSAGAGTSRAFHWAPPSLS